MEPKGANGAANSVKGEPEDVVMHSVSAYQSGGGNNNNNNNPVGHLPPLAQAIYEAIKTLKGSPEGVEVGDISKKVIRTQGSVTGGEIS